MAAASPVETIAALAVEAARLKEVTAGCWAAAHDLRARIDKRRAAGEKLGAMAALMAEYTAAQVKHNETKEVWQDVTQRLAVARQREAAVKVTDTTLPAGGAHRHADPHSSSSRVRSPHDVDALYNEVTSRLPDDLDLSTADPHVLAHLLEAQGRSATEAAAFIAKWEAAHRPGARPQRPPLPPLRVSAYAPPVRFPRTVYGEGVNFEALVRKFEAAGTWRMVHRPEDASVVWERDILENFRANAYDCRRQALNRFAVETEVAFADKARVYAAVEAVNGGARTPAPTRVPCLEAFPLTGPHDMLGFMPRLPTLCAQQGQKWILKRTDMSAGFGLTIIEHLGPWWAKNAAALMANIKDKRHRYLLQRYLDEPMLIKLPGDTEGRKFDLRMYFLVACADPLIVYTQRGTARLNIEEYRRADYANRHVHISNIAQQRTHPKFAELQHRLKLRHDDLQAHMEAGVYERMTATITRTIEHIVLHNKVLIQHPDNAGRFELFAADFILDRAGVPYLMEMQSGVAISHDDPVSVATIPPLVDETLSIAHEVLARRASQESLREVRAAVRFEELINEAHR